MAHAPIAAGPASEKSYTWGEIRDCLHAELKACRHILTYGTIGSCNIEHDIDTIVTKNPGSSSAEFYRELHRLFDQIDAHLETNNRARLIRTSRFSDEEESKYIAKCSKSDLVFQVMSYVSLRQINMHWFDSLNTENPVADIEKFLKSNYDCIYGNPDTLFENSFAEYRNEELFIRLNDSDRINSHFPGDFLVRRMNVLYDFIMRKRLKSSFVPALDELDCRRAFYDVCSFLDRY
ncbi:MAG TPA: hypothetical protein V6C89_00425 [Drouetiella sp.]|jgi:hypothetical protein